MDTNIYIQQLEQINLALESLSDGPQKDELLALKTNITELLSLTNEPETEQAGKSTIDNEFDLFMSEMKKDGAVTTDAKHQEGSKCRAPHKHQWGDVAYHNAMICTILNETEARVLFTNPTHQEMLPCPYYFETDCKFTDDKCRFSHGEIVQLSTLQDYIEPEFDKLVLGSHVLAKKGDNLWHRAVIRRIYDDKCLVKFQASQCSDIEVSFEHILPLFTEEGDESGSEGESDDETLDEGDVINMSLMIVPSDQALGDWEKHTKGIGSKLMQKMGYIVGSGLGRRADGRIDPVTAVILPAGKSLDHCMELRERAGGDKDLFSAERKLRREQRKQEELSRRNYERDVRTDVFDYLNETVFTNVRKEKSNSLTKSKHREIVKKETNRSLNVASLQIEEKIKNCQKDLAKLKESLQRHCKDTASQVYKSLKEKLNSKMSELSSLQAQSVNIRNEQNNRSDKKKLTIF